MSKRWYQENRRDPWRRQAKSKGYRARSAYKLKQIQDKFQLIRESDVILDVGCHPGGWTQVVSKLSNNTITAVDKLTMLPIKNCIFINDDIENLVNSKNKLSVGAYTIAKFVDFAIAFIVIFGLCLYYGVYPKLEIVYMPLLIINLVVFVFGLGLWFSSMAIQYRDVNQIMTLGIQVLMFAAPVIWPISYIPDSWQMLYALYPMVGIIEGFRACFIQGFDMPILLSLIHI